MSKVARIAVDTVKIDQNIMKGGHGAAMFYSCYGNVNKDTLEEELGYKFRKARWHVSESKVGNVGVLAVTARARMMYCLFGYCDDGFASDLILAREFVESTASGLQRALYLAKDVDTNSLKDAVNYGDVELEGKIPVVADVFLPGIGGIARFKTISRR